MCTLIALALIVAGIALCAYAASRFDGFDRNLIDEACYGLDRTRHTTREHKEDHP